jgi:hypothetical protein
MDGLKYESKVAVIRNEYVVRLYGDAERKTWFLRLAELERWQQRARFQTREKRGGFSAYPSPRSNRGGRFESR